MYIYIASNQPTIQPTVNSHQKGEAALDNAPVPMMKDMTVPCSDTDIFFNYVYEKNRPGPFRNFTYYITNSISQFYL